MNFLLLVAGNTVSVFGNGVYLVSVLLMLAEITENAVILGVLQFAVLFPAALLGPLGGVLADRVSRVTVLVTTDLFRGAVMIGLGVFFLFGFPVTSTIVILSALAVGVGNALFQPAVLALVPSIVTDNSLSKANGIRAVSSQVANIAGTAVGGLVFALFGAATVFLVNGITYVFSGLSETAIRVPRPVERKVEAEGGTRTTIETTAGPSGEQAKDQRFSVGTDIREGFAFLASRRDITSALLSYTVLTVLTPPVVLSIPFFVNEYLALNSMWVGLLLAGMLVGGVVGFLLHGAITSNDLDRSITVGYLSFACALGSLSLLLLFLARGAAIPVPLQAGLALGISILGGGAIGWTYVAGLGYVQRQTSDHLRSRVLSAGEMVNGAGVPVVYLLSGLWIQRYLLKLYVPVFSVAVIVLLVLVPLLLFNHGRSAVPDADDK